MASPDPLRSDRNRLRAVDLPKAAPALMRRRPPWLTPILAAAALLAAGAGAWLLARPTPVQTVAARIGPAIQSVYASGVVDFVRQARIAPVINAPIRAVRVAEGQDVRAGQVLVELAAGPEEATALQLEAQASQAHAAFTRTDRLFRRGFAAAAARDDAWRQFEAATAAARAARERLRDYRITAPFAGRVLRRDAEPGDLAHVGTPLFVLADPASLRITADIDERDAGRMRAGLAALVRSDAFPGRQFSARVSEVTPQGDATARIFRARLSLEPGSPLRPGMTVEVNIVVSRRDNAVLAPANALREGAVWIVEKDRARRRPVQIGVQGPDQIEIRSGLRAGEQVVIKPPANLKDGARVSARAVLTPG
jgi:RND family efflux transporter MFP subunit